MPPPNVCSRLPSAHGPTLQTAGAVVEQVTPLSAIGVALLGVVIGLTPSWPLELPPQHWRFPPATAQLWLPPAVIARAPLDRLATVTGWVGVPGAPSSPEPLLPQHRTSPPTRSAQVWLLPAAIAV